MSTIRSAIQVTDGMSPAFRSMNKSLNIVISSFEQLQRDSSQAVDTSSIQAARIELNKAETSFNQMDDAIEKARLRQEGFNTSVERGGGAADGLLSKLKSVALQVGAAFGVKKILEMSDAAMTTRARLDLMNDGLQTTEQLQTMIYQSAQRSRTAYTDTANAVAKLGILAKDAFSSNAEMVAFAEQMNKQFKIGGASIQEQTSAMYQLTQAMAAGRLQGDEFRSILENAPMLAQSIADHMGKTVGELRKMSSEGLITADVIKGAMFAAADETNAKFATLPMTFGQVWTEITNATLMGLQPLLLGIGQAASWISQNYDTVIPVVLGLATAVGVYTTAVGVQTAVTWLSVAANRALIATMLSNPLMWVALLIGVVVGAIYKWVEANGGVQTSLLMLKNYALIAWDAMRIGAMMMVNGVLTDWENLQVGTKTFAVGIANAIGDMRVNVLNSMQNMVNGAIDLINKLISVANKIPGVNINAVQSVSFAADSGIQNEAEKQARNAGLAEYTAVKRSNQLRRDQNIEDMKSQADLDRTMRESQISSIKSLSAKESAQEVVLGGSAGDYLASIDENTGGIKDAVSMSEEDLRYLRDIAEQDVINRFTTAEIKVDMQNTFGDIRETADLDGVVAYLEDHILDTITVVAEGAPANV